MTTTEVCPAVCPDLGDQCTKDRGHILRHRAEFPAGHVQWDHKTLELTLEVQDGAR